MEEDTPSYNQRNMVSFHQSEFALKNHQKQGHMETGPWFKVSCDRLEKIGMDLVTPGSVVQRVIHYTILTPKLSSDRVKPFEMNTDNREILNAPTRNAIKIHPEITN